MSEQILELARAAARDLLSSQGLAVLSTTGKDSSPHCMWMGTATFCNDLKLVTITSSTSRKVENIEQHPEVEWMFTAQDFSHVLYLRGHATIVRENEKIRQIWQSVKDKRRAWFLKFEEEGIGFVPIETKIESVEFRIPQKNLVLQFNDAAKFFEDLF